MHADVIVAHPAAVGAVGGREHPRGREERTAATPRQPEKELVPALEVDRLAADDAARVIAIGLSFNVDFVWHGRACC